MLDEGNGDYRMYDLETNTFSDGNWSFVFHNTYERPNTGIDSEGNKFMTIGGSKLMEQKANGELYIGENSWITKEENGRTKVYAKDAACNPIPIDYTNGTKLLINGRDVDQAIDNVGALSAALTGLPTVP